MQRRQWINCTLSRRVQVQAAGRGLLEWFLNGTYQCNRLDAGVHAAHEERSSHRGCIREGTACTVMRGRLIAQGAVPQRDASGQRYWRRLRSSSFLTIACSNKIVSIEWRSFYVTA